LINAAVAEAFCHHFQFYFQRRETADALLDLDQAAIGISKQPHRNGAAFIT
jgi:hypothetical protein